MILEFKEKFPKIDPTAFVAENATVIGDVEIGPGVNIWFHNVVRSDLYYFRIIKSLWSPACPLDIEFVIR